MKFVDPDKVKEAPVRVVVYVERELYEKADAAARMLGATTVDRLIVKLLHDLVEDLESRGFDLSPFWEKK
jgi:hypothetical protein